MLHSSIVFVDETLELPADTTINRDAAGRGFLWYFENYSRLEADETNGFRKISEHLDCLTNLGLRC